MPLGTLLREIHGTKDRANNHQWHGQQEKDTHNTAPTAYKLVTVELDLETGVYNPPADAILQMAVGDHDGHVLLHTLVWPVRHTAVNENL
jgi:hypothetical protein